MELTAQPILILGARAYAREALDLLSETPAFSVKGFVENLEPERCATLIEGLPVYWIDELAGLAAMHWGICSLGTTRRSRLIEQAAAYGLRFATVIHPGARVSTRSTVGEGTLIAPGVQVASHSRIGSHARLNRGVLIGHDTEIGELTTLGPGANIAGYCRIGAGVHIGIGAIVVDHVSIGAGSVVAAGAVVTRDVPEHVMVAGMPAVIIKREVEGL